MKYRHELKQVITGTDAISPPTATTWAAWTITAARLRKYPMPASAPSFPPMLRAAVHRRKNRMESSRTWDRTGELLRRDPMGTSR